MLVVRGRPTEHTTGVSWLFLLKEIITEIITEITEITKIITK